MSSCRHRLWLTRRQRCVLVVATRVAPAWPCRGRGGCFLRRRGGVAGRCLAGGHAGNRPAPRRSTAKTPEQGRRAREIAQQPERMARGGGDQGGALDLDQSDRSGFHRSGRKRRRLCVCGQRLEEFELGVDFLVAVGTGPKAVEQISNIVCLTHICTSSQRLSGLQKGRSGLPKRQGCDIKMTVSIICFFSAPVSDRWCNGNKAPIF